VVNIRQIQHLENLEHLDISHSNLRRIPPLPKKLITLKALECPLSGDHIKHLTSLESIHMSSVPPELARLTRLENIVLMLDCVDFKQEDSKAGIVTVPVGVTNRAWDLRPILELKSTVCVELYGDYINGTYVHGLENILSLERLTDIKVQDCYLTNHVPVIDVLEPLIQRGARVEVSKFKDLIDLCLGDNAY
jgi:hypothetical protein